jgi:hypothetical protein
MDELTIDEAREELIRLLEAAECRITEKAEQEGRKILRQQGKVPTQWAVFDFALQLLKANFPLHAVPQGDPPGCHGIGYEMRNTDGRGLYIKLKLENGKAWLISFHY